MATVRRRETKRYGLVYDIEYSFGSGDTLRRERETVKDSTLSGATAKQRWIQVNEYAQKEEAKRRRTAVFENASRLPVAKIIPDWIDWMENNTSLRPSTIKDYKRDYRNDCSDFFDMIPVGQINRRTAEDYVRYMKKEGYAPKTIKHGLDAMGSIFRYLIAEHRIALDISPFTNIKVPGSSRSSEPKSLTEDQVQIFLLLLNSEDFSQAPARTRTDSKGNIYPVKAYATPFFVLPKWIAYLELAITTGMRPQEMLALKWKDINFEERSIRVERALEDTDNGMIIGPTKTDLSNRTVYTTTYTIDALKNWKKAMMTDAKALGSSWLGEHKNFSEQLCFPTEEGDQPMDISSPNRQLKRLIERWNKRITSLQNSSSPEDKALYQNMLLPEITQYDLRHTFATIELAHGTPAPILAAKMGHSDLQMLTQRYLHPLKDAVKNSQNAFSGFIHDTSKHMSTADVIQKEAERRKIFAIIEKMSLEETSALLLEAQKLIKQTNTDEDM